MPPRSRAGVVSSQDSDQSFDHQPPKQETPSFPSSLRNYAFAGAGAALLLSAIEWIDLSFQLTPVFQSTSERLVLTAYFSLNLMVGLVIGMVVGLFAHAASFLKARFQSVLTKGKEPSRSHKLLAALAVAASAAAALSLQPHIHGYSVSLLRELEKFPHLGRPLVAAETPLSYLVVMGLFIGCWTICTLARQSGEWSALMRRAWLLVLLAIIGAAYYADSRIEVQQYEYSMHRSMFLVATALAMAFIASIHSSPARSRSSVRRLGPRLITISAGLVVVALLAALTFTFANFDKNQNLKTQVFYRSTQMKQYFKLAQWALDFDRDGYSPYLGGGDADDRRADVNPGVIESVGDGVDNNCVGGDLTQQAIEDWQRQFSALNAASNPEAKRLNVMFFFIDTLRADHLGAYGYKRNTSPNIDKLAARSSVFENAYTASPYTYEAAPKFMQSAYWDAHYETWTEALARDGYNTILFPRRLSMLLRHVKGMEQTVDAARRGLKQTVDAAIEVLGSAPSDRPVCSYIYVPDPHRPYRPHEGFDFGPAQIDRYDGEIAYTDYHLGRLFDWMEQAGRMNDTMIVIMSDHGESFGERKVYKHNSQLYDDQMRVPMIVYVPGQSPRRIPDYVTTADLGATILKLVGIDVPKEYAGVSLLALMRGEPFTHPPIYGEHFMVGESIYAGPEKAVEPESRKYMVVTQDGFKLIYNRNFFNFELYDLKNDPLELHNLYDRMPQKSAEMKLLLGRFVDISGLLRPRDADEHKFFRGLGDDEDND
ncbi:MAG: sulfatase [Acidobacteriota bacterium]